MGRPSKKEQRTEEILNAFYRCVARYGLEGSTLEFIAKEADLKRSLVRHYVGNREDLVNQLVDRVLMQSDSLWVDFMAGANQLAESCSEDQSPEQQHVQQQVCDYLIEGLFGEQHSDAQYVLVIESLIFSANHNANLRKRLQDWLKRFIDDIKTVLSTVFTTAAQEDLAAASFGIISIYFNLDSLAPLGMNHIYRKSARHSAQLLLNSLSAQQASAADNTQHNISSAKEVEQWVTQ